MSLPPDTAALAAPVLPPDAPIALASVPSPTRLILRRGLRHTGFLIGAGILGLIVLAALAAPLIAPHDPYAQDVSRRLLPPVW